MWLEKIIRFWKSGFVEISRVSRGYLCVAILLIALDISGCTNVADGQMKMKESGNEVKNPEQGTYEEIKEIAELYKKIYANLNKENMAGGLEVVKSIVNKLGEAGYSAVDSENQIDMTEAEQVIQFCEKVEAKEEAEITIIVVGNNGSFTKYDLITNGGNVMITRGYYLFKNDCLECINSTTYAAHSWTYTKEGYLFFGEYHMTGFDGPSNHAALRVQPLDERCRELNRQYILPIGYGLNDLFLSDWSEEDFGEVDFYDLFDIFYPIVYEKSNPYVADENCSVGAIYQIPKEEFEHVLMSYFNISSETLQSKTTYFSEDKSYEYRPRGLEDCEPPEVPYPEVVDYVEHGDGTLSLTVNVVYPDENISKVYAHEVVVRLLTDGGVQYVSNRIIPSKDNYGESWHVDRLTEEEWEEVYGDSEIISAGTSSSEEVEERIEKGYQLPVDDREKEEVEEACKRVMKLISEVYEQADKGEASNIVISEETIGAIQAKIKETGYPVIATKVYSNMENYERMENFLKKSMEGISGSIVMYEICSDGSIGRKKYIFDGNDMYVLSANTVWNEENKMEIAYISYTRMKQWKYTEKGWFCYELCVPEPPEVSEVVDGNRLLRVQPMTEEYRDFSEKCVLGLGYKGNNLLCSNWDTEHMEGLDYNGMYEYLYELKYQKKFNSEDYPMGIPKEEFESLIKEYLPVTSEQIQQYAVFDQENQTYEWKQLGGVNYELTFFGTSVPEVTNIKQNEDGTVTLTVDAVCEMILGEEAVITHELTIRLLKDGNFQYLGNKILDDGIKNIPEYQYRL